MGAHSIVNKMSMNIHNETNQKSIKTDLRTKFFLIAHHRGRRIWERERGFDLYGFRANFDFSRASKIFSCLQILNVFSPVIHSPSSLFRSRFISLLNWITRCACLFVCLFIYLFINIYHFIKLHSAYTRYSSFIADASESFHGSSIGSSFPRLFIKTCFRDISTDRH